MLEMEDWHTYILDTYIHTFWMFLLSVCTQTHIHNDDCMSYIDLRIKTNSAPNRRHHFLNVLHHDARHKNWKLDASVSERHWWIWFRPPFHERVTVLRIIIAVTSGSWGARGFSSVAHCALLRTWNSNVLNSFHSKTPRRHVEHSKTVSNQRRRR